MIGVGNELRGDDAAALTAARLVAERGETVVELEGDASALLDLWHDADEVVIVDTMRSGAAVGTLQRFDASETPLPAGLLGSTSSHAFGLAGTIELARTLGRLPARVIVWAIEGEDFALGSGLSPAVAGNVTSLADAVVAECGASPPSGQQPSSSEPPSTS